MQKWIGLVLAAAIVCTAYADSINKQPCGRKMPVITETPQTIQINPYQPQFTLRLPANPTTGYTWALKQYDTHLLALVKNEFLPPDSNCIGASGYEIWTFKAKPAAFAKPMSTTVTLEYARSWEKQAGKVAEFTVVSSGSKSR